MRAFQQGSAPKILRIKGGGRNEVLWQMRSRGRGDADLQRSGMGLSQRAVRVQRHCLGGALGRHEQSVPRGASSAFGWEVLLREDFRRQRVAGLSTEYALLRFPRRRPLLGGGGAGRRPQFFLCGCSLLRRSSLRTPSVRDDEQRVSESELVWARCQYRAGKDLSRVARYDRLARSPRRAAVSAAAS